MIAATHADIYRIAVGRKLNPASRSTLGQFMTPEPVASYMASLFKETAGTITLIDPGAGVGTLTAAFVDEVARRAGKPDSIDAVVYETEPIMLGYLASTLDECRKACKHNKIKFTSNIIGEDFIKEGVRLCDNRQLFDEPSPKYSHCIINPPYKKICSTSDHRFWLRQIGIETTNLYSAFLSIVIKLLAPKGELVAIVPRSFCNGVYFKQFRQLLLGEMALKHIHVFDTRNQAFKDDKVLQENIIFHAIKKLKQGKVTITSSSDHRFEDTTHRRVDFDKVVKPGDPDQFIHIAVNDFDQQVIDYMSVFTNSLKDLGIDVSTGPVVDFRLKNDLRQQPEVDTHPLIYPTHFTANFIEWPKPKSKKPNAIFESEKSARWLMPNKWYVLTKRFSSKEERRRIVAAINDPKRLPSSKIGIENHLNVLHEKKDGLDPLIAKGLAIYLNSTLVDLYFRQFSGHTQVNATDLRMLHYPDQDTLIRLGKKVGSDFPDQHDVDAILEVEIEKMTHQEKGNPVTAHQKIQEALSILKLLGLPKGQRNDRSALTLLALLDLKPERNWGEAGSPLMGITPIMNFAKDYYGRSYAPNTRETFRRQSMHQFMEAGVAVSNPDRPARPINSPKWCYQIEPSLLTLLKTFGSSEWEANLTSYMEQRKTLAERYAKERKMRMIPLVVNGKVKLSLSPGVHSQLIKDIIEQFGPKYAPGAEVLYVGDTGSKMGYFDEKTFKGLGLVFDSHGKFPDVVLYFRRKNWLLLIESVTSHGPVDSKRYSELSTLFNSSTAGLVYVTAFPDRQTMARYLSEISWETEVWVADNPTHLIHFNGERFLGPYE